ncbi:hypothetical protein Pmar_PMAR005440 [Perkinsus marinus ATCC 50983]|uniref:Potassium channel domain-containing protein n=1 Tax=Perkinsus marinus (strain ATCC 50983 / TXsc) TaxID=423536 RepID=C5LLZ6_PERM5|nr:hypothetical protein Pmar_PMAR005440 [Perkinsus marinus ATCC 50983]EER02247.1 hypothetical protein Pmar_PMAR005440 [Perkinsus marinus ATCC 50983]|eukprot:XP_002769529.1 hypothetical protein Pmar_PMAR005440 [Perkinsus marinus ATCC 50983]
MRVFTRGGRRSIISPRGEVNVHRLIPRGTKVQTLFTIGYGGKEPLCFDTNVGVTIISILGMIMHTALTGIVFTKFTLDSRNVKH